MNLDPTGFSEMDIEATVVVHLKWFHQGKIALPMEVELCPIGLEAQGWRAYALRILREAAEKRRQAETLVLH